MRWVRERRRESDHVHLRDATRFAIVVEGGSGRRELAENAQGFRAVLQGLEIELESGVVLRLEAHVWSSVYPDEGNDPETLLENATSA